MYLFAILGIVLAVSLLSLLGGLFLIYRKKWARFISKYFINFAIGAMFGVVFLELLPEAVSQIHTVENVLVYSLAGIIVFYLLEKSLLWYHHHSIEFIQHKKHPREEKIHPVGYLTILGDSIHNFLDGVMIAASFLVNFRLGIVTSLAVLFHELPCEIGNFCIMLHAGFRRSKVIMYNVVSQLTAVLGALFGVFYLPMFENLNAILLAFAAGGLIYIASADLLPETHREKSLWKSLLQIGLLILGIAVIWYVGSVFPE